MSPTGRCSRCGKPLSDRDDGLCPACLVQLGLDAAGETTIGTPSPASGDGATMLGTPADPRGLKTPGATQPRPPSASDRIGPYRLIKVLGEGGMGVVYLAEQTEPITRIVALKLIKLGMDTREVVARFEAERQTLALMDHPNIASVLDAGATADGRPYFVMEYAPGVPITEYCDAHQLTTSARLGLFITVCAAVQHAHQKGIIHRDLKPSNVLVIEQDGQPVPKVIDFGIAKATDQRMNERTQFTQHGLLVGTPEYMSPEQTDPTTADLDTRTDIYALGVVLYELLVGGLPFSPTRLREAGYTELLRIIREEEPLKPSARLTGLGATATDVAARRHTKPPTLASELRGDLDWITLKALEKDRARRYGSASELAADLTRYLQHEPIVARPPSASYRMGKFVRRNRLAVGAASLVGAAVIAGLAVSLMLYARAERNRREAVTQRDRADAATATAVAKADAEARERAVAEAATAAEATARQDAQRSLEKAERNLYLDAIDLADRELTANYIAHVDQILGDADPRFRNWEWDYLSRINHRESKAIPLGGSDDGRGLIGFAMDAAGKRFLTASISNQVSIGDVDSGRLTQTITLADARNATGRAAISRDGRSVAMQTRTPAGAIAMTVWDLPSGRLRFSTPARSGVRLLNQSFSPSGTSLVAIESGALPARGRPQNAPPQDVIAPALIVWDAFTGVERLRVLDVGAVSPVEFDPDGSRLAVATAATTRVLDASTGRAVLTLEHPRNPRSIAFSADGAWIAELFDDLSIRAWNARDGREAWSAPGQISQEAIPLTSGRLVLTPDGQSAIWTGTEGRSYDPTIHVWDGAARKERARLTGHVDQILDLGVSAAGNRLVSAGLDNVVRIWDVPLAAPMRDLGFGADAPVMALSQNQRVAATLAPNGAWTAWNLDSGELIQSQPPAPGASIDVLASAQVRERILPMMFGPCLSLNRTGTRVMVARTFWVNSRGRYRNVHEFSVFDLRTHRQLTTFRQPDVPGPAVMLPAGVNAMDQEQLAALRVATLDERGDQAVVVTETRGPAPGFETSTEVTFWTWAGQPRAVRSVFTTGNAMDATFSPDGASAVISFANAVAVGPSVTAKQLETATGHVVRTLGVTSSSPSGGKIVAYSRDSRRLAAMIDDGHVEVWDAASGAVLTSIAPSLASGIGNMAFSPDGSRIALLADDASVRLYDTALGRLVVTLRAPNGPAATREYRISSRLGGPVIPWLTFSDDGFRISAAAVPNSSSGRVGQPAPPRLLTIRTWDASPRGRR